LQHALYDSPALIDVAGVHAKDAVSMLLAGTTIIGVAPCQASHGRGAEHALRAPLEAGLNRG